MKKIITQAIITCFTIFKMQAQTLSPQVIASTGGFSSSTTGSLSYTMGEMTMVQTFSANGNILTQGFQQPSDSAVGVGLLDIKSNDYVSFFVYPNPAISDLWYGFLSPEQGHIAVTVYDILGQKIEQPYIGYCSQGKTILRTNALALAPGTYLIEAVFTSEDDGKEYKSTKRFEVIR